MRNTIIQVSSLIILLFLCIGALTALYFMANESGGSLSPGSIGLKDYISHLTGNRVYFLEQLGLYRFILTTLMVGLSAGAVLVFCTMQIRKPFSYGPLAIMGIALVYLLHLLMRADDLSIHYETNKYLIASRAFIAVGFYFILTIGRRADLPVAKGVTKYFGIVALVFISMRLGVAYSSTQSAIPTSYYEHLGSGHFVSYLGLNPISDYSQTVNWFNSLILLVFSLILSIVYWALERAALNALVRVKRPD
ncbi:MAG TPA: hypothetical protein VFD33_02135 [Bacillota bacterium]|nr:hypothetical protein [Bacillota bacterium]